MLWWLFSMLFRGLGKDAAWTASSTSGPSLAAWERRVCRTDTSVCLVTFGCPLGPIHREAQHLDDHSSQSQTFICMGRLDRSCSHFQTHLADGERKKHSGFGWEISGIISKYCQYSANIYYYCMTGIRQGAKEVGSTKKKPTTLPSWGLCSAYKSNVICHF